MKEAWLNYLNLSDHYERKARFLPAVLSILPLLPVSVALGAPLLEWIQLVVTGLGLGAVVAVAVSHVASACGNRLQERLWPDWPHDSPTNSWLHPTDTTVSAQQKQRWYRVIRDVTQLDIQQAIDDGEDGETRTVINDAVKELRSRIWKTPVAERVSMHNVDYGFARNLTGMRPIWLASAVASAAGCWAAFLWLDAELVWGVVSAVVLAGAVLLSRILPTYVRRKANYYAESFFAAVISMNDLGEQPEQGAGDKE